VKELLVTLVAAIAVGTDGGWPQPSAMLPVSPLYPSMAMEYVVPLCATNVIALCSESPKSSSLSISVSAPTDDPVYAASSVSKLLPAVLKVIGPLIGDVQLYQTDAPPEPPA